MTIILKYPEIQNLSLRFSDVIKTEWSIFYSFAPGIRGDGKTHTVVQENLTNVECIITRLHLLEFYQ